MKSILRPLVLLNMLFAAVSIFPIALFIAVDNTAHGTLIFNAPALLSTEREMQEIRSSNDIELLRLRAVKLVQMLDFELRTQQTAIPLFAQISGGLGLLLAAVGAGFLLNTIVLGWVLRTRPAGP